MNNRNFDQGATIGLSLASSFIFLMRVSSIECKTIVKIKNIILQLTSMTVNLESSVIYGSTAKSIHTMQLNNVIFQTPKTKQELFPARTGIRKKNKNLPPICFGPSNISLGGHNTICESIMEISRR